MKIGLFFGSFNPMHIGHALIARYALEVFKLEQIWFVVSPHNPMKFPEDFECADITEVNPDNASSLSHRFRMVEKVCHQMSLDNPLQLNHYLAVDVEYSLPMPSYTADTLRHLCSLEENNSHDFCIIMGSDCLHQLHKWKDYNYILENFPILVYPRPGTDMPVETIDTTIYNIQELKGAPYIEMSSTKIRDRVKNNKSILFMVPDVVRSYILTRGLYE